ncbi:hypothetical protein PPERSA_03196 [Pseudocohnilembus persalinus]|uniref:Uncharacterized protein n=1 Tax=Pseudocohnilembus persalinus TaxID=266149 RepID=A0A0V0QE45_PSEPJ|nr:hypothetical protein PPERSA_03196 [Pseudocohnilembus persalinus]|eukprot:KRX00463.1 hypothetical protein PPERSA_03196 [Pseudocohnilembus persalinus]
MSKQMDSLKSSQISNEDDDNEDQPSFDPKKLFQMSEFEGQISYQTFLNAQIIIRVIGTVKKMLHSTIKQKYEQADLPNLPSKMQIIGKNKKRQEAFQQLFAKIIQMGEFNEETKKKTRRILYNFLFIMGQKDLKPIKNQQKPSERKQSTDSLDNTQFHSIPRNKNNSLNQLSAESSQNQNINSNNYNNNEKSSWESPPSIQRFQHEDSDTKKNPDYKKSQTQKFQQENLPDQQENKKELKKLINEQKSGPIQKSQTSIPQSPPLAKIQKQQTQAQGQPQSQPQGQPQGKQKEIADFQQEGEEDSEKENFSGEQEEEEEEQQIVKKIEGDHAAIQPYKKGKETKSTNEKGGSRFNMFKNFNTGILKSGDKASKNQPPVDFNKEVLIKGYIYVNFKGAKIKKDEIIFDKNDFKPFYGRVTNSELILISEKNYQKEQFDYMIPIKRAQFELICKDKYMPFINLFHEFDKQKIMITTWNPQIQEFTKIQSDTVFQQLQPWIHALSVNKRENEQIQFMQPTCKVQFDIQELNYGLNSFSSQQQNQQDQTNYFVCLSHQNMHLFTYKTQINQQGYLKWNQKIQFPILNNFSSIKVELIKCLISGWVKEKNSFEVVAVTEILVADILQRIHELDKFLLEVELFPISKEKSKEKKLASPKKLKLKIENLSNKMAYCSGNQTEQFEEMPIQKNVYERFWLKSSVNRLKRIKVHTKVRISSLNDILNFKYKKFSYIFYAVILIFSVFFRMDYFLSYIILALILAIIYNSKYYQQNVNDFVNFLFFSEQELHPDFVQPKVKAIKDIEEQKFLSTDQISVIKSQNLLNKYRQLKDGLAVLQYNIFLLASFLEKLKNLVIWEHPAKTKLALIVLLIALVLVSILPFREIIIILILLRARKGKKAFKEIREHNRFVLKQVLTHILSQEVPDFKMNITFPNEKFPFLQSFQQLQKSVSDNFQIMLGIDVPENQLLTCNTVNKLIDHYSTYQNKLYVSKQFRSLFKGEVNQLFKKQSKVQKILSLIVNFLYNIPSDFYRVLNPQNY